MNKILILMMAALPMTGMAQNVWETPQNNQEKTVKKEKPKRTSLFGSSTKEKKAEDPKYLAGAVPVQDGKVVFTLDRDVKGKTASQIYDIVYSVLDSMAHTSNQIPEKSGITTFNKTEHQIIAHYKEWLVFRKSPLNLDQTQFDYTLVVQCTDNHLHVDMVRLSYNYEEGREGGGMKFSAEEWITDKDAINKKGDGLVKRSGIAKFRRKTIDRKDNIFETINKALDE